jgi:hypothetical protein
MARPEKARLGEMLIQQKLLTQEQLKLALEEQKRSGRKLGRTCIELGYVTEEAVYETLAKQLQHPYINLKYYNIKPEVKQKLTETQARRFRAIVLEDKGASLLIGMADPTDLNAYDEIARILKREIEIAVVTESQLLAVVDRLYRRTGEITGLAQDLGAELGDTAVEFGALAVTPSDRYFKRPFHERQPTARLANRPSRDNSLKPRCFPGCFPQNLALRCVRFPSIRTPPRRAALASCKHALLVTARAEVAPLAGEGEPVVVPAGSTRARLARSVDAASRRRSTVLCAGGSPLLWFALRSHSGRNARTTGSRHRNPVRESNGESKSTAGIERTLKNS